MESHTVAAQAPPTAQSTTVDRARRMWSAGDFARVAARTVLVGELLCRSLDIHAGERVLDVAAGSGNAAIAAARRDASVTATDIVEPLLAAATERAAIDGLSIATAVADAQELPFEDESFDVVLSTFGVMFAPDQQRAADELLRVCKPHGRIGLANWTVDGMMAGNMAAVGRHSRTPPAPAGTRRPIEWGSEARVRELFGDRIGELRTERRTVEMCAESAEALVEFNRTWFGPVRTAFSHLDEPAAEALKADLIANCERFNRATDGTLVAQAEYLEHVAIKR